MRPSGRDERRCYPWSWLAGCSRGKDTRGVIVPEDTVLRLRARGRSAIQAGGLRRIQSNNGISSLECLQGDPDITNTDITNNDNLHNGFGSLESSGGNLRIGHNAYLQNAGLGSLASIGTDLRFYVNANLETITGFGNLDEFGDVLSITTNFNLLTRPLTALATWRPLVKPSQSLATLIPSSSVPSSAGSLDAYSSHSPSSFPGVRSRP